MSGRRSATILVQLRVPLCCRTAQALPDPTLRRAAGIRFILGHVDGPHCGRGRSWPKLGYSDAKDIHFDGPARNPASAADD